MPSAAFRLSRVVLALLLVGTCLAQMKPGDRRKAYGEVRASIMESVLTTLYPGAQVQWEPQLKVQMPGGKPRTVEVPVYVRGSAASGGLEGVATVELDGKKERFIFDAKAFQRTDSPAFSTVLVVFRADTSGHIERYKKLLLDPTEIKTLSIQDWSQKQWPTLEIQYDTHVAGHDSFATIEWHSILDANRDQFVSRLPFGITRKVRGGPEQSYAFSIRRNSPTTLLIADPLGGRSIPMTAPKRVLWTLARCSPSGSMSRPARETGRPRVTVRHAAVASGKFILRFARCCPTPARRRLRTRSGQNGGC